MSEERFYYLLSQRFANEESVEEKLELDELLRLNRDYVEIYEHLLKDQQPLTQKDEDEADASFALHVMKMHMQRDQHEMVTPNPEWENNIPATTRKYYGWATGIAALLFFVIGYYVFTHQSKPLESSKSNEIVSRRGSKSDIKLPDGTRVWLNADSKLSYGDFAGSIREVFLSGEAFFDVVKDSSKPFIIHTDRINIRVLGTSFNVRNYPQDENIETSLIHGKIELTLNNRPAEKFILHPNEKLTIRKNQGTTGTANPAVPKIQFNNIVAVRDSLLSETAWMDNKIVFSNESLENIARLLERQFDITVEFRDDTLRQFTFTGIFDREKPEEIMRILSLAQPFHYQVKGARITIGY